MRGELIGGADIVEQLAQNGELREKLDVELGTDWPAEREERVVARRLDEDQKRTNSPTTASTRPIVAA